jgi:hypothetical protein
MRRRCNNPDAHNYHRYGGQGVNVHARYNTSFANFLADIGPRPEGTTLDRRNNARGYMPGNIRWATPIMQAQNRRPPKKRRRARLEDVMAFAASLARATGRDIDAEIAQLKRELQNGGTR